MTAAHNDVGVLGCGFDSADAVQPAQHYHERYVRRPALSASYGSNMLRLAAARSTRIMAVLIAATCVSVAAIG